MRVKIGPYRAKKRQKVSIHIDKWDTWNMDYTLALIIVPMLKQLKDTKHGIPSDFVEEGEDWVVGEAKWDFVLDKIIWSFEQIIHSEYEEDFHQPNNLNLDAYYAYNEHIQEGLNLFGKYYRSLWD